MEAHVFSPICKDVNKMMCCFCFKLQNEYDFAVITFNKIHILKTQILLITSQFPYLSILIA